MGIVADGSCVRADMPSSAALGKLTDLLHSHKARLQKAAEVKEEVTSRSRRSSSAGFDEQPERGQPERGQPERGDVHEDSQ
eukprot:4638487-Prymnesium_polylepis.1